MGKPTWSRVRSYNMVRHPTLTRAHDTCGGSTRAANSRTTRTAAQHVVAGSGGPADEQALGQERGDRAASLDHGDRGGGTALPPGGRGGVEVLTQHQRQPKFDSWKLRDRHGARGRRGISTRRGRVGRPNAERRGEWVRTGYGNWVRWSPPAPKAVKAPREDAVVGGSLQGTTSRRAARMKKTRKTEAAEVQLKRKVKALETKCAELLQQVAAATRGGGAPAPTMMQKKQVHAAAYTRSKEAARGDGAGWTWVQTTVTLTITALCWSLRTLCSWTPQVLRGCWEVGQSLWSMRDHVPIPGWTRPLAVCGIAVYDMPRYVCGGWIPCCYPWEDEADPGLRSMDRTYWAERLFEGMMGGLGGLLAIAVDLLAVSVARSSS